jgi:hypothetical protein
MRKLGSHGLEVSAFGLGCITMSDFYGAQDDVESAAPKAPPLQERGWGGGCLVESDALLVFPTTTPPLKGRG